MKNPKLIECERTLRGDLKITSGITLRDLFAGLALKVVADVNPHLDWKETTEESYKAADAMLAAREGK